MRPGWVLPSPLYPITDLALARASCHGDLVRALAFRGARLVQIREKTLSTRAFYLSAERAVAAGRAWGAAIVVNDDPSIALAAGADGVHLGGDDMPVEAARRILGEGSIIGVSTHSVEEALRLAEGPCDYVALGPVYASSTKRTDRRLVGPEGIAALRARTDRPIVAIGGIDEGNLEAVLEAGADAAAVIGAVMSGPDPGERFASLLRLAEGMRRGR